MTFTPAQPIPPPQPQAQRYGLFTAAVGPLDLPDHAIGGGLTWTSESCGSAHTWPADCHPATVRCDDEFADVTKTIDPGDTRVVAAPFIAYGSVVCGSAGVTAAELAQRAEMRLQGNEQLQAEAALAANLATSAPEIFPADSASIASVVSELEQWLYGTAGYGYVGYLHAPPRVAALAAAENLINSTGSTLTTSMGTRWVFGAGYPDNGYMYISGLVTVWRSPTIATPPPQIDISTNQWTAIAERAYAVGVDCHAARAFYDWMPLS